MIRWYRVGTDPRVRVGNLGLACCSLEVESAVRLGLLLPEDATSPEPVRTVLLASGTMTTPLGDAVAAAHRSCPSGTDVVAVGACATAGGPYWDAPSVVNGVESAVPVRTYVPGCPPRPEALVDAVLGRTVVG